MAFESFSFVELMGENIILTSGANCFHTPTKFKLLLM
jgi:hypothetical protein